MSTGKRLAKRSIIGTRVCAPGIDGKYYSGVIHAVKTPGPAATEAGLSITPKTRYSVRFDAVIGGRPPSPTFEYSDRQLIGPGFGSVTGARLVPGQKVFLTYNGREIQAEVTQHKEQQDEVEVKISLNNGQEGTMSLTKRLDEVRLLESRKSARLADQDTDFARLADMAGDRKRASSHSIDVPHVPGSRKRRPSSSNDSERSYNGGWVDTNNSNSNSNNNMKQGHGCGREGCRTNERGDCMDECTAALVLMSLSCSPHSPHHPLPFHCQPNYGSWESRTVGNSSNGTVIIGSPGIGGTSNSGSSSSGASWRSGTPSPPLSEEGGPSSAISVWPNTVNVVNNQSTTNNAHHSPTYMASGSSYGSTPGSTGTVDEGIWSDYWEDMHPRKKKSRARSSRNVVETVNGYNFVNCNRNTTPKVIFQCTWKGCAAVSDTCEKIEQHIRDTHLGSMMQYEMEEDDDEDREVSVHEEEFYYQEVAVGHMSSPPTMSHRDMARPPHEDPEYQKQLRLEAAPVASNAVDPLAINPTNTTVSTTTTNKERIFNFRFSQSPSPGTPMKHIKFSPRQMCQQNIGLLTVTTGGKTPSSPRKVRGDTKKCRKIYGMDNRDLWCTQCKWKKACSRFGE